MPEVEVKSKEGRQAFLALLNRVNPQLAQAASAGNEPLLQKLSDLYNQKEPPQELGFMGKAWATVKGVFVKGGTGALFGGAMMGGITYGMDKLGGGELSGRLPNTQARYEDNKLILKTTNNKALFQKTLDEFKIKHSDFNPDLSAEELGKKSPEDSKKHKDEMALFQADLNKAMRGDKGVDKTQGEHVWERFKFSAILSGAIGGVTALFSSGAAAEAERKQEIAVWNMLHSGGGKMIAANTAQAPMADADMQVAMPNVPYNQKGMAGHGLYS